jgi:phosphohistidine phosphatase SixA
MRLLAALALTAYAAVAPAQSSELRGEQLMHALRNGGYTILLRHARTDRSFKEAMGYVPVERSAQRNLTDDGVHDAKLMGVVLKKYEIPIGEIVASPMYRTRETAEYAAGTPTSSIVLRSYPPTDEQAMLVAQSPKPGTNRLLVTHHFVIEKHVPGIKPGEIGESEAAIIQTTSDGRVQLVGRITLSDWEKLAGAPPKSATIPGTRAGTSGSGHP